MQRGNKLKREFHRKIFLLRLEAEEHLDGVKIILAAPVLFITIILNLFGLGTHKKVFPELYRGKVDKMNYLTERLLPAIFTTLFFIGIPFAIHYFWGVNEWLLFSISVFSLSITYGCSYLDAEKRARNNFVDFKIQEAEKAMSELFWWQCEPEMRLKWFTECDSPELSQKRKDIQNSINYWEGQRKL